MDLLPTESIYGRWPAPSWFITFAPADINHRICLYYDEKELTYCPKIMDYDQCPRLIASNPVAGARFFHFMVELFIKHVLRCDKGTHGLYGHTSSYYDTVEQQGRLTLHMHMLVWIKNAMTPQEICENIMDSSSTFQVQMVQYLESLHKGEFIDNTMLGVQEMIQTKTEQTPDCVPPTETLPEAPFVECVVLVRLAWRQHLGGLL